jgi:hypothetical protein
MAKCTYWGKINMIHTVDRTIQDKRKIKEEGAGRLNFNT